MGISAGAVKQQPLAANAGRLRGLGPRASGLRLSLSQRARVSVSVFEFVFEGG